MLHSNPGDYAWGQSGLDAIVTQVRPPSGPGWESFEPCLQVFGLFSPCSPARSVPLRESLTDRASAVWLGALPFWGGFAPLLGGNAAF